MMNSRTTVCIFFLLAGLSLAGGWSLIDYRDAKQQAGQSRVDTDRCIEMSDTIHGHRSAPAIADDTERLGSVMSSRIESAATEASLSANQLVRITPNAPVRLGESDYRVKPTHVALKNISMKQCVRFVHTLLAGDPNLRCRSLRLSAPRHDTVRDRWSAEVSITYLIYDPVTRR
jgi:hypothetical protein